MKELQSSNEHEANSSSLVPAKHFFTDPEVLLTSALTSLTFTNPHLSLDLANKIIFRAPSSVSSPTSSTFTPSKDAKISLISGGGAGHEPSFTSLVGPGLLTASISGTIFASPSSSQINTALLSRVTTTKGVLVIVMNYTGDVLNFGMAVEKARAKGIAVEMVVVGDDVGVGREKGGKVGRRGIAGTVLVVKIAGALAERGASLADVSKTAKLVADNIVSVGASLSHVHVPGRSANEEEVGSLGSGEIEVGMGIHNEAGSERVEISFEPLIKKMLAQLLSPTDKDRSYLDIKSSDDVVLLVNNLGGVSVLEMGGICYQVVKALEKSYAIKPVRILCGTYMTSLNGMGFSISLLRVKDVGLGAGKGMLDLLDMQAEAVGWSAPIKTSTWEKKKDAATRAIEQLNLKDADKENGGNLKCESD
jgi:dihydroxyacetone kinase